MPAQSPSDGDGWEILQGNSLEEFFISLQRLLDDAELIRTSGMISGSGSGQEKEKTMAKRMISKGVFKGACESFTKMKELR